MSARGHIPAENMMLWRTQLADNRELRHLQIAALARALAAALEGGEEFPLDLPELEPSPESGEFWHAVTVDERLALCREILALRPDLLREDEPLPPLPASPRVARLSGGIFAGAATALSPLLPLMRPVYLSSLTELLEATASGEADAALLPIEDAKGNRFLHFHDELERLDLHISHTCDVLSPEEGRHSRFALVTRLYQPHAPIPTETVVECRVPGDDPHTLTDLLTVSTEAGLTLRRLDALPVSYAEDGYNHYPVFLAPKGTALLETYLRLFLPGVSIVGHYLHVKGKENI